MPPTFKRTLCAVLVALGSSIAGPAAMGQDPGSSGFDGADADRDGVVTPGEWDRFSFRLFDSVDRDGDGLASADELRQSFDSFDLNGDGVIEGRESPLVIILGDGDGDGRVSPDEFQAIDWNRKALDRDADGAISREEFRNARRDIYDRADFDRSVTLNRSEYEGAPSLTLFRF